jgi:hypothetical protein
VNLPDEEEILPRRLLSPVYNTNFAREDLYFEGFTPYEEQRE